MNTAELFDRFDTRLRANIARLGVSSPQDQEDIAQGVWAKLSARQSPPSSPDDWIFAVARNDVKRHGHREARRRAWHAAAAELGTAVSPRPFDIDRAIGAVRSRLSDREDEIMVAAMTTRSDAAFAKKLGYPTVKIAQSARSRLRTRIRDILREEVDVSFMFDLMEAHVSPRSDAEALQEPVAEASEAHEPSAHYTRGTLDRIATVEELRAHSGQVAEPWFGSFAEHFARSAVAAGKRALWARALSLPDDEIDRIASGRRTVLELDPDLGAVAGVLLGIPAEDTEGLALADVGLRPLVGPGKAVLKEERLPAEEATLRIRALQVEEELLRR